MLQAKDEGSSRRKGKEVTVDDPLAKTVGEKTPFSKSNHSEEEEQGCDSNSECPPFIALRYDTHIHFLVVPSDYSPPSSGHEWLSICRCDIEVS